MENPISSADPLLKVDGLVVRIGKQRGVEIVRGVSFNVAPGETLCIVGESGCGKTLTALSLLRLHTAPVHVSAGRLLFEGRDLLRLSENEMAVLRGNALAMIFQDPMSSLNPVTTIGEQIVEVITAHRPGLSRNALEREASELLTRIGIPAAEQRLRSYPHQLSGGMRQRILIAMALANGPRLIVADEPTTALDVTIQAQVMDVMRKTIAEAGAALVLITHDMGLVAETADRVLVMYAGRVVEEGTVFSIFRQPRHPYTRALLDSIPKADGETGDTLFALAGEPPSMASLPLGCAFRARCSLSRGRAACAKDDPGLRQIDPAHYAACHFAEEMTESFRQNAGVQ